MSYRRFRLVGGPCDGRTVDLPTDEIPLIISPYDNPADDRGDYVLKRMIGHDRSGIAEKLYVFKPLWDKAAIDPDLERVRIGTFEFKGDGQ